ncbi:ferric reductase like transmembrane component-domain-containing protein [Kalaharituber pfeilii]|nr:ferric reductase like transmembrane component-domain-containing protein [Kalaharituber pfeilii]
MVALRTGNQRQFSNFVFPFLLFFVIPTYARNIELSENVPEDVGGIGTNGRGPSVIRRQDRETLEKAKCPSMCQENLQKVFNSMDYDDIPKDVKVDPIAPSSSPHDGIVGDESTFWCRDRTYLASMYLCLQQHCTSDNAKEGWEELREQCDGGLPTESEIKQDMQLQVVQIRDIEVSTGKDVQWSWMQLWAGLTHNAQALKNELKFNMLLGWCLYALAGSVLLLASIHHAIARYRAKNIDFKENGQLEALSTISHRTRATILLSRGTKLWTYIRRHLILPALFGQRHLEPIGWVTLPTRVQFFAVVVFIGVNTIFLVVDNRSREVMADRAAQPGDMTRYIGDRAGFLSLANLPIIFLLGGRNNFLISVTGLSYGVFNVFHKWVARVATILAIIHSISYAVYMYQIGGAELHNKVKNEYYWWNGVSATIVMSIIVFLALLPFRRKVYELFLILHIIGGILFLYFCFQHLKLSKDRVFNPWLWACIGCWSFDRLMRFWRILKCNTRKGKFMKHNAKIKIIKETNIMKISIYPNKDGVGFFPGAHYFLYFGASWKFWQSHPFTAVDWRPKESLVNVNPMATRVKERERERRLNTATSANDPARLGTAGSSGNERLGTAGSYGIVGANAGDIRPNPFRFTEIQDDNDDDWDNKAVVDDDGDIRNAEWKCGHAKITFLVRPHKGITQTIWNRIVGSSTVGAGYDKFGNRMITPGSSLKGVNLKIKCFIEGPYGHQHNLHTFDTVVVIAGGIGVSTTLAYLYDHMARAEKRVTHTRRFVFVWSCREDMLMDRLISDADLMNKTQDCSALYGTQIVMMLYFTGTPTKKQEVKFVEPRVREVRDERGEARGKEGGREKYKDRDGGDNTKEKVERRPSTARKNSKSEKTDASPPLQTPPPAYYPQLPQKFASPPKNSRRSPEKAEKAEHSGKADRSRDHLEKHHRSDKQKGRRREKDEEKQEREHHHQSDAPPSPPKRRQSNRSHHHGVAKERDQDRHESEKEKPRRQQSQRHRERDGHYHHDQSRDDSPLAQPPLLPRHASTKSTHKQKSSSPTRTSPQENIIVTTTSDRPPLPLTYGRPNIAQIIEEEIKSLTGTMAVLTCGPDKMVDGTREAVVKCVGREGGEGARVQYFEEAFGW